MAVQRDINKEKLALKSYQSIYKKNPTTAEDWANLHRIAYPVSAGGLPDELKSSVNESLYNGTGMASVSGATAPLATDINTLRAGVDSAAANVQKTSQPNEALRILQEAIRAKSGQANQSIGENPLFKQLGVTGMGALSQSIASQGKKLDMDFANFSNIVSQMSGTYKDLATAALNNYQIARDRYKEEADKITQAEKDLLDHQQAIELANLNFQNSLKLKAYEDSHPGINDIINAQNAGMALDSQGNWINKSDTIITSPSGNSYDWSTYNAPGGLDYIRSVQASINRVGKLNNYSDLASYINNNMAGSNIQPIDIINVSNKTGVGWEELLGLIQKESPGGASNVAKNNNNFGGITWSQSYQDANQNVSKGTARPANEGGNYVKFATPADGLMAQAEQFAKRKVTNNINNSTDKKSELINDISVVTANMPVNTQKAAVGAVTKYLESGDTKKAQDLINQYAIKSMKGTILNDFNSFNLISSNLNKILADWDKLATDSGPYKQWQESGKPFAGVVKDQKWVKFMQSIEENQAKYRNAIYGASLTDNELKSSNRFMVDPSRDDIQTIKTKLQGMQTYAENAKKAYVDISIGKPSPMVDDSKLMVNYSIIAPDGNTYSFSSQADLDNFKKEAGIK